MIWLNELSFAYECKSFFGELYSLFDPFLLLRFSGLFGAPISFVGIIDDVLATPPVLISGS
jgi:hypothetical protein